MLNALSLGIPVAFLGHYYGAAEADPDLEKSWDDVPALIEKIWNGLEADLLRLPLPLLAEFTWMLSKTEHPLRPLMKAAEKQAMNEQFGDAFESGKTSLEKLFNDFSEIIDTLRPDDVPQEQEPEADDHQPQNQRQT